MSKIVEFKISKGVTIEEDKNQWRKKSLEFTVQMSEKHTDEEVQVALTRAEYILDTFLGKPEVVEVPQFNSEELMKHEWKGRKTGDGQYAKGSMSWGWDFASEFSKEILQVLEKGPITIDKYEISLSEGKNLVQTKKKN